MLNEKEKEIILDGLKKIREAMPDLPLDVVVNGFVRTMGKGLGLIEQEESVQLIRDNFDTIVKKLD